MAQTPTNAYASKTLRERANPLASLENTGVSRERMVFFPNDLADIDHWVTFRSAEYVYENRLSRAPVQSAGSDYAVRLPVPAQLQTGYGANYDSVSLGAIGNGVANIAKNVENLAGMITSWNEMAADKAREVVREASSGAGFAVLNAIASTLKNTDVGQGISAGIGVAVNPHMAVIYTGTGFRSHRFSYKLSPKNAKETDALKSIIDVFKISMAPELVGHGQFFKYPREFVIEFHHQDYLFKIGRSVLESFDVNYHGQGPAYFRDRVGAPQEVEVSMVFKETAIVTRADAENGF